MVFSVGEKVIYGATGVCKITDISENKLSGVSRKYYILSPVDADKSIIYVPIDNEALVNRMHAVPTENKLRDILSQIKGESTQWIDNNLERAQVYNEILYNSDIKEVIKLFRTLHSKMLFEHSRGKRLYKTDERIYKDTTRVLTSQLSKIMNISSSDMLSLILE